MLGDLSRRDGISDCGFRQLCEILFGSRVFLLTCRGVRNERKGVARNSSNGAVSKVDLGQVRGLVSTLGSRSCRPGPTEEACVPGGGKGVQPLNVPSVSSGLIRRMLQVLLRTVCRNDFRGASRNFQPGHDYRATLVRIRGGFATTG